MHNVNRWWLLAGALLLAAFVGVVAWNAGVDYGTDRSALIATDAHHHWHYPGFFFFPSLFFTIFFFVVLLRVIVGGRRWRHHRYYCCHHDHPSGAAPQP